MGQAGGRLGDLRTMTWNAGLKVRLSQPGLNYGAAIAVDVLAAELRQIIIPNQIGQGRMPVVGLVDYEIEHIKVNIQVKYRNAIWG